MKNRGHLEGMIDQIFADTGRLPLLFSTVTSANTHWWHLHRLLPTGRASDMEALDLLSSDDEDQRLPEDDLHRVAEEQHDMAEEQHRMAEVKRRNWVEDSVCW